MSSVLYRAVGFMSCVVALALVGCGSSPMNRAPVEDRGTAPVSAPAVVATVKPPPGFENAGKPGFYTVKPGDTLIRIGLESGQSHKDISRWNALENPNKIEVGQVLRIVPPAAEVGAVTKPVSSGTVTTTPIATAPVPAPAPIPAKPASAAVAVASAPVKVATAPASSSAGADDDIAWIWPGKGSVIAEFDESKNKGVDISGTGR